MGNIVKKLKNHWRITSTTTVGNAPYMRVNYPFPPRSSSPLNYSNNPKKYQVKFSKYNAMSRKVPSDGKARLLEVRGQKAIHI